MVNKKDLFPIGIGTWGVGGFAERNTNNNDEKQINAISHMFNSGMNFCEANLWYSQGLSAELLQKGLKHSNKKREDVFICQAVYIKNGGFKIAEREVA